MEQEERDRGGGVSNERSNKTRRDIRVGKGGIIMYKKVDMVESEKRG